MWAYCMISTLQGVVQGWKGTLHLLCLNTGVFEKAPDSSKEPRYFSQEDERDIW